MKLLLSLSSPYARKVRVTARVKGLANQIEEVITNPSNADNAFLLSSNPLSKIPVLVTDDGTPIYDSHVICEYLDAQVASPTLFPGEGPARWATLTTASLADGILDAAVLIVYEGRFRSEETRNADWVNRQWDKINGAITQLEAHPPEWTGHPNYGDITVACALGYLDFRYEGKWRAASPKMVAWLEKFAAAVPAFAETTPPAG